MDGNGRWARARGVGRTRGHREGAKRVDEIVTECCELGIRYLTLYTFSTENWNRPLKEVNLLMRLLVQHLRIMDKKLQKNHVSLRASGTLERLPKFVQGELKRVIKITGVSAPHLTLTLALSYGGRQEIIDATKAIVADVASGKLALSELDDKIFRSHLYQADIPDPDLLIRTGGEYRLSNFLLWQTAYTELYVTPLLWPDFKRVSLHDAILTFGTRQRRFGKTQDQLPMTSVAFGMPA